MRSLNCKCVKPKKDYRITKEDTRQECKAEVSVMTNEPDFLYIFFNVLLFSKCYHIITIKSRISLSTGS